MGQHFLCSSAVVGRIQHALEGVRGALEIGPGPGVLTSMLCSTCEEVAAIEIDTRMIGALAESAPCAHVSRENALHADLLSMLAKLPQPRAIVSNLPYYLTGPLLTRIAQAKSGFDLAILMMQREVARRVVAAAGTPERGSLSVFLQLQFEISRVTEAPSGAFLPPPKVDSEVLSLRVKVPDYEANLEETVFQVIRIGFKQPRKTLLNNLLAIVDREGAEKAIETLRLDLRTRPQQLQNSHWIELARALG